MAKDYARPFYDSKEWRKTREAYLQSQHYICERCGGAASVVHHIRYKRIDNYEGYTDDISLYCKLSNDQNIEVTEPDAASV